MRRTKWWWRLEGNPVVVTISTVAALVTIAAFDWPEAGGIGATSAPAVAPVADAAPPVIQPPVALDRPAVPLAPPGEPPAAAGPLALAFPHQGERVGQFIDMRFDMADRVPPGYAAIAFVRDPLRQYWSFGTIPPGAVKRVQIGTKEDRGREFEVGVWITDQNPPPGEPFNVAPSNIGLASASVVRQ
jgi:hypothetical protein